MIRVLVLHGFGMSGELMKSRLGFIRSDTKKLVEWIFIDGPLATSPADAVAALALRKNVTPSDSSAINPASSSASHDTEEAVAMYSWFDFSSVKGDDGSARYVGAEEAMHAIDSACRAHGPFDGVLGFSQGAVVAAMWIARQQAASQTGTVTEHIVPQSDVRLRFGIFCSGLLPSDPTFRNSIASISPTSPIATLHCYGESDAIIAPSKSEELRGIPLFNLAPAVALPALTHPGGHVVASAYRKTLKQFLQSQAELKGSA